MTARPAGTAHGDTDPHGAVWCGDHTRCECSKNSKRSQERCHDVAIVGRHACKTHVGESTAVAVAKGQANVAAYEQHAAWSSEAAGRLPALDPSTVVMEQLSLMTIRADLYGERLRLQLAADGDRGLVGVTHAAGREGMRVETGEAVRSLAKLESAARDSVVRYAKTAHDMGIDERNIEIEESKAARVVTAVKAALDAVALGDEGRDRFLATFLEGMGRGPVVAGEVEA